MAPAYIHTDSMPLMQIVTLFYTKLALDCHQQSQITPKKACRLDLRLVFDWPILRPAPQSMLASQSLATRRRKGRGDPEPGRPAPSVSKETEQTQQNKQT